MSSPCISAAICRPGSRQPSNARQAAATSRAVTSIALSVQRGVRASSLSMTSRNCATSPTDANAFARMHSACVARSGRRMLRSHSCSIAAGSSRLHTLAYPRIRVICCRTSGSRVAATISECSSRTRSVCPPASAVLIARNRRSRWRRPAGWTRAAWAARAQRQPLRLGQAALSWRRLARPRVSPMNRSWPHGDVQPCERDPSNPLTAASAWCTRRRCRGPISSAAVWPISGCR